MTVRESVEKYVRIASARKKPCAPAAAADVAAADARSQELVGKPLPDVIHEIWKSTETLADNGAVILPPTAIEVPFYSEGFLTINEEYEPPAGMVHIGQMDDEHVSWRAEDGKVFFTDLYTNDPMPEYDSIEDFIADRIDPGLDELLVIIGKMERGEIKRV